MLVTDLGSHIQLCDTAIALGAFDGVHLGHRAVIEAAVSAARENGLEADVFTFSQIPKNAFLPPEKRVRPLTSQEEKLRLLTALGVDTVFSPDFTPLFRDMSAETFVRSVLVERLRAKTVVCGFDHRFGAGGRGDASLLLSICGDLGVKAVIVPPVKAGSLVVSSTEIRRLIEEGRIDTARELLGHDV